MKERLDIRCASMAQPMRSLSGGNQQKALIARWLATGIDLFVIDEPTQGVDIGARADIASLLRSYAAGGGTVLFASSDLYEVQELATRVIVLHRGEIVADIDTSDGTPSQEELLAVMTRSASEEHQP